MALVAKVGKPKGGWKERSGWTDRVARLPKWIRLTELSRAAGFEPMFLGSVKIGAKKLDRRQAKAVIRELKKLEKIIGYTQGDLFE